MQQILEAATESGTKRQGTQRHSTYRRSCPHCKHTIHIIATGRPEIVSVAGSAAERHRMIQTRINMDTF